MIDWPLALSTASQAFANDLRQIDKEVSIADLKLKIADLTGTLADLKTSLLMRKLTRPRKTRKSNGSKPSTAD